MSDLRKAAEMALEAMQTVIDCRPIGYELMAMTREQRLREKDQLEIDTYKALRQTQGAIEAIRQALAHQPEPIAWMVYSVDGQSVCITDDPTSFSDDQRALPLWPGPFEREWVGLTDEEVETFKQSCHLDGVGYDTFIKRFAIGIEAKLKEKNGG